MMRMKKLKKLAVSAGISASLLLGALCMPLFAAAATSNVDGAMIRNEPSTEGGIIGSLNEGDEVTILDAEQSGDGYTWYYIQLSNGNTGYVRGDLLSVDDSEIEALGLTPPAEEKEEEKKEEEPQEPAAASTQTTAAPAQEPAQTGSTADGGYNAATDPDAKLRLVYEEDGNGGGYWFVYNDDNGTKIRVGDMTGEAQSSSKNESNPWKAAAIIFGIIAVALAGFVLFMLKSIRDDRANSARRRAAREDRGSGDDGDDGNDGYEDEEYFFVDGEEDLPEDADEVEKAAEPFEDGTVTAKEPVEVDPDAVPDVTKEAAVLATEEKELQDAAKDAVKADEAAEPAETIEIDVSAETTDVDAPAQEGAEAAPAEEGAEAAPAEGGIETPQEPEETEDTATEPESEEPKESAAGQAPQSDDLEEEYDEEEYYEEDDQDGDYAEEEYDDEEPPQKPRRGIAGFFKKILRTDSGEDDDYEDEYEEEEEEPEEFEFDESKEYPEDVDLLPRDDLPEEEFEEYEEEVTQESAPRSRLSVQSVMKNAGSEETEVDFTQEEDYDAMGIDPDENLTESLIDDDDDMEYSFLGTPRRR